MIILYYQRRVSENFEKVKISNKLTQPGGACGCSHWRSACVDCASHNKINTIVRKS